MIGEREILRIDFSKGRINGDFIGVSFKDGDSIILFIPSLQLSAYGDNYSEAEEMLKVVFDQFWKDLLELGEILASRKLAEMGWQQSKFFKKRMENLSNTTYEDIKRQFDIPDDVEMREVPLEI